LAGAESRIGRLLAWTSEPDHAPQRSESDRLAGVFTVSVLVLALATLTGWLVWAPQEATGHVVALLVITCPCALGMARPLASAIAVGQAARAGVFVRNETVFDRASEADVVVLDKTGTLTEGRMLVVRMEGDPNLARLAAHLERGSSHPIGAALVAWEERLPPLQTELSDLPPVTAVTGAGIEAQVDGRRIRVGRPSWTAGQTGDANAALRPKSGSHPSWAEVLRSWATDGLTPVAVSVDGRVEALFGIADPVRAGAQDLIDDLTSRGVRVTICSGDDEETTRFAGRQLGIEADHCLGRRSPEDKQALVQELQERGHTVMLVGDGVNDVAAMRAADVGVAVTESTDAGRMAADAFSARPGLDSVRELIQGSRSVLRLIRINLGISLVYNVLGAGLAIAGLVTPLVAAVAMPASSFVVVAGSTLHRSFRKIRGA